MFLKHQGFVLILDIGEFDKMTIGKGHDKGPQKSETAVRKALRDAQTFARTPEARLAPQGSDLESLLPEEIACGGGGGASRAPKKPYAPILKASPPPGFTYGAVTSKSEKDKYCDEK